MNTLDLANSSNIEQQPQVNELEILLNEVSLRIQKIDKLQEWASVEIRQQAESELIKAEQKAEEFFTWIEIKKLQKSIEQIDIHTHFDERLLKLREQIQNYQATSNPSNQPVFNLDNRFTTPQVIANRNKEVIKINQQAENGKFAWIFSQWLNRLWIKDKDQEAA